MDTALPQTTIDSGPPATTTSTSASFEFSASETGVTFACSLDGAAFATCTSPSPYSGLSLGTHEFRVQATDAAGNADPAPATYSWTIEAADTSPPETTIDSGPIGPTNDSTPTFAFSSEEGATFECSLDGGDSRAARLPTRPPPSATARHLRGRGRDAAGNVDPTPASRSFTVDTALPQATIASAPSDPTTERSATFTFDASEAVQRFECSLDSGAFATCSSGVSYPGPLALGGHTFRVRAVDLAGNVGPHATHTWTIVAPPPSDTTPPVITITGLPSPTQDTNATFAFSANEPATFRCRLDTATFDVCSSSTGISYSGLLPGEHVFRVEATDGAGNASEASYTWTIVAAGSCTAGATVTVGASADAWVLQSSATSNYGGDSAIKVDSKSGSNARALVRFSLPAVPSGCAVTGARLRMYAGSYKAERTLEAVPLAASWSESGVTWANQPAPSGPASRPAPARATASGRSRRCTARPRTAS